MPKHFHVWFPWNWILSRVLIYENASLSRLVKIILHNLVSRRAKNSTVQLTSKKRYLPSKYPFSVHRVCRVSPLGINFTPINVKAHHVKNHWSYRAAFIRPTPCNCSHASSLSNKEGFTTFDKSKIHSVRKMFRFFLPGDFRYFGENKRNKKSRSVRPIESNTRVCIYEWSISNFICALGYNERSLPRQVVKLLHWRFIDVFYLETGQMALYSFRLLVNAIWLANTCCIDTIAMNWKKKDA